MLSAYVDGVLSSDEQATLEARLEREPALRERLQGLRLTVEALANLEEVETPRNFILSPAMVATPRPTPPPPRRRRPAWSALSWATTVATLLLLIVLAGDFFVYAPSLRQEPADQLSSQPQATDDREAEWVVEQVVTEKEIPSPAPEVMMEEMETAGAEAPAEEVVPAESPAEAVEEIPPPAALGTVEGEADIALAPAAPATLAVPEPAPEDEQQNYYVVTTPSPGATPGTSHQRSLESGEAEEAAVDVGGYSPSMTQTMGNTLYPKTPSFETRDDDSAGARVATSSQKAQNVPLWLRGVEATLGLLVVSLMVAMLIARRRQRH
jgi:hypothetical protein